MSTSIETNTKIKKENLKKFPLVEIELDGNISFKELIDTIYYQFEVPYKLIKADIEYLGNNNYGNLLLLLQGAEETNENALTFLRNKKIRNKIRGYE